MHIIAYTTCTPWKQMQAKVQAEEWAALMGCKRGWLAREQFAELKPQQLEPGQADVQAARWRVVTWW